MRVVLFLKKRAFALFFLFFAHILSANQTNPYILSDGGLIDLRAAEKIYEIGSEVKAKLGVDIYVYAKENYDINMDIDPKTKFQKIKEVEDNIIKELKKPYVVLTMSLDQTHVNLLMSDDLKTILNKNDILNGYVVPLLASFDKNSLIAKTSAAVLNGYAEIGDRLADAKGIELDSSIGSGGKTAGTIWKVFMYFLVFGGIILYTYAIMKRRK
jgi:hypothetical protein